VSAAGSFSLDENPELIHFPFTTQSSAGVMMTTVFSKELKMGRPVVHFEIGCRDSGRTADFFSRLFGWQTQAMGPATMINTGTDSGIQGHITTLGHEPHHYTIFYVEVDDVQGYLDKATAMGGRMLVPPVEIPTGTFAWFTDLEGNTIGLWKPK
jgi:hypothetical protein